MRIFFVFLLLVNLLFAVWIYTQPSKQPAAVQALPAGLKSVELLHSQATMSSVDTEVETPDMVEPARPSPVEVEPAPEQMSCYTLGPFEEQQQVEQVKRDLAEQTRNIDIRRRAERQVHRYWVFIPPQANRQQAIEVSKALARSNIKDYYIVASGDNNNAVSLGHFREKTHADRRMQRVADLGFEVEKRLIYREYDLFWLDFSLAPGVDSAAIAGIWRDQEGVALLDRDCKP